MRWEELREEQFEDAIERSKGVCVIPIGCLEKHGQHLPVGTDSIIAEYIANMAAEQEEVVVFPTTPWLGVSIRQHWDTEPGKNRKRGYIAMNPHTLLKILEELCDEIARNGFKKVLIVNYHGGNFGYLDFFTQAQNYNKRDYVTMVVPSLWSSSINGETLTIHDMYRKVTEHREDFPMLADADISVLAKFNETGLGGGHACFFETANILGIHPELVNPDRYEAESGLSTGRSVHLTRAGIANTQVFWDANFPNAYNGYAPIGCTENIGKALNQILTDRLATIYKIVKEDDDLVRMALNLPKV